jgi:hypothetical protein
MKKLWALLLLLVLVGSLPAQGVRRSVRANFNTEVDRFVHAQSRNRPVAEVRFERAFGGIVFFPVKVNSAGPLRRDSG